MFSFRTVRNATGSVIIYEENGVKTTITANDVPPEEPRAAHFDYCIRKIKEAGLLPADMPTRLDDA